MTWARDIPNSHRLRAIERALESEVFQMLARDVDLRHA
jgi:hypothetical protein